MRYWLNLCDALFDAHIYRPVSVCTFNRNVNKFFKRLVSINANSAATDEMILKVAKLLKWLGVE